MELNEIIKLAKLSLNQRKMLPENPGIYFVIGKIGSNLNLLYVGKTETTLKERWKNHHRYKDFKILEASGVEVFIAWICPDVFDSQMLANLEKSLINLLKPPLNDFYVYGEVDKKYSAVFKEVKRDRTAKEIVAFQQQQEKPLLKGLDKTDTAIVLKYLQSQGWSKQAIIEEGFGVRPGTSKFRDIEAAYDILTNATP